MISADVLVRSLVGQPLRTPREARPNTILAVRDGQAIVATRRSPNGRPVPLEWLQDLLDRFGAGEEVPLDPWIVRQRSSFLGAVLLTLPMVEISSDTPPIARVNPARTPTADVLLEFEARLGMYADLLARGGPTRVPPEILRELGIYAGASGIWSDARRTRGIAGSLAVTVGLLHTGRHYPDDLSDDALLYHYPETERGAGRDRAEVEATKAAGALRLPVFVVLQEGERRTVRRAWVSSWDDTEKLFLVEFGPMPTTVVRGDVVDEEPFELFENREDVFRRTRGRPNQQRFKLQVIQRYGGRCVLCDSSVVEWLDAAHLVGEAERGAADPRNGLPFCKNHHAALDRGIVCFDPQGRVHVRRYTASELGIARADPSHLPGQPAGEALDYRWEHREPDGWSVAF